MNTSRWRLLRRAGIAALLAATVSVVTIAESAVQASTISGGCRASRMDGTFGVVPTLVWSDATVKLNYTRSGNTITVKSVSYSFSAPLFQYLGKGPVWSWWDGLGTNNDLHITSPVKRDSPDTLGTSGTYDFPDFTTPVNSTVKIKMIPDFRKIVDPTCTASFTVA